ncbi:Zinc finger, RING/FYVE/PHD-type [Quillaja saponaria]|uniref:Zinc finger, RING/FYVE/PHD-type n=1 Tax=Quillaja saponaria TaxID=32244 RepID=A0AAD7PUE3_QUISA|nr:Zinc finger, RING/FYVE/PHD-type [Quillaja saponaria]
MAYRPGNNACCDVAADSRSLDSLSFSGFLSSQDQQPKPPSNNQFSEINKQDSEFEFGDSRGRPNSIAADPIKRSPADLLISNYQIQPQAPIHQPEQSPLTNNTTSLGTLLSPHSSKRSSYSKEEGQKDCNKPHHKMSKEVNKECTAPRSWFGQKVFQSFVSPCRECRAVEPTAKGHTIARKNI